MITYQKRALNRARARLRFAAVQYVNSTTPDVAVVSRLLCNLEAAARRFTIAETNYLNSLVEATRKKVIHGK